MGRRLVQLPPLPHITNSLAFQNKQNLPLFNNMQIQQHSLHRLPHTFSHTMFVDQFHSSSPALQYPPTLPHQAQDTSTSLSTPTHAPSPANYLLYSPPPERSALRSIQDTSLIGSFLEHSVPQNRRKIKFLGIHLSIDDLEIIPSYRSCIFQGICRV